MKMIELEEFEVSPRWTIRRGSIVRFAGGGPEYRGTDGEPHKMTLPGRWRVRAIYRRPGTQRFYLEVSGLDLGGVYTPLVHGKGYRSNGLLVKPYNLRKPRSGQRVAKRLGDFGR